MSMLAQEDGVERLTHVVKDGTQDEGHCRITEKLEEGQTGIGLESPESSLET